MKINDIKKISTPVGMVSQYWPTSGNIEGATLAAINLLLEGEFFEAIQTVEVSYSKEREAIAELVAQRGFYLDYCVARVLNSYNANLSSLDMEERVRSVALVKEQLKNANHIGARSVSFVGGKRPDEMDLRNKALTALTSSMVEICEFAGKYYPHIDIMLEALDVDADKKHAFGYTDDAVRLLNELTSRDLKLYINVDTAHIWLNSEDPISFLEAVRPNVKEFHFCNCVVDPNHSQFGDLHMEFGEPGLMTHKKMSQIIQELIDIKFLNAKDKPYLLFEAIKPSNIASETHMLNCQEFFTKAVNSL